MPTMASLVEEFQRQAWLVHGRVPYAQAQPRTRTEQHQMLEKAAEAILMTQGIKVQVGIGGQLMLRLPGSADVAGMVQTAAEAEAVQEGRVQGADGFFLGTSSGDGKPKKHRRALGCIHGSFVQGGARCAESKNFPPPRQKLKPECQHRTM